MEYTNPRDMGEIFQCFEEEVGKVCNQRKILNVRIQKQMCSYGECF